MPNEFIARNGVISRGNLIVSGSVISTSPASFSGSLNVTGSITATGAATANQVGTTLGSVLGGRYFSGALISAGTVTYGSYATNNVANLDIYANNENINNGALLRLSSRFGGDEGAYLVSSRTGSVVLAVNGINTFNYGLVLNGSTMNVGIGGSNPSNPTARLHIIGSGATSSTTALLVQNANASASLSVTDDRLVTVSSKLQVGTFTPGVATGSSTIFTTGRISAGGGITLYSPVNTDNNNTGIFFNDGLQIYSQNAAVALFRPVGGGNSGFMFNVGGYAYNPSSGTGTVNTVLIDNSLIPQGANSINYNYVTVSPGITQGSFGTGTIRGFYFAPSVASLNTSPLRAFESTRGDVIIGGNAAVTITGSLTVVTGSTVEFQVNQTGVKIGNATTDSHAVTGSVSISSSFSTSGSALTVYKSGSSVLDIQGSQGQLFSVVDALSGSLMSVNDVSGLPILEVFSDDRVVMGTYGAPAAIITGSVLNVTGSLVTQGQILDPAFIWFMS